MRQRLLCLLAGGGCIASGLLVGGMISVMAEIAGVGPLDLTGRNPLYFAWLGGGGAGVIIGGLWLVYRAFRPAGELKSAGTALDDRR